MVSKSINGVPSDFATDSDILQQKLLLNFSRPMEIVFYQGFKEFAEGKESIEDKECSGRFLSSRTDENVDRICDLVRSGC